MSTRQILSALTLATAFAVPHAAQAEPRSDRAACFLEDAHFSSVRPYYGKPALGRATLRPLRGAEVQLAPARQLSSTALEAQLERLLRHPRRGPLPVCLLDVGHVHIESDPLGNAASVQLIARDPSDAEQVYRRAERLVAD